MGQNFTIKLKKLRTPSANDVDVVQIAAHA